MDASSSESTANQPFNMADPKREESSHLYDEISAFSETNDSGAKPDDFTLISFEKEKAELQKKIAEQKHRIRQINKTIAAREVEVRRAKHDYDRTHSSVKDFFDRVGKERSELKVKFETAVKSREETTAAIDQLTKNKVVVESEILKLEDELDQCKWYGNILFRMSPLEWKKAQTTAPSKTKHSENEKVFDAEGAGVRKERELTSKSGPPSAQSDSLVTVSSSVHTEEEETLTIYFSDPAQFVLRQNDLRDQVLFQMHNSREENVEENILTDTYNKIKVDERELSTELKDLQDKISREKKRGNMLKKQIQMHKNSEAQNKDAVLKVLGQKVTKVYSACLGSHLTNLSTLEKLKNLEHHVDLLLQQSKNIPDDVLHAVRKKKRNTSLREEKIILKKKREKEKMKKCKKRLQGKSEQSGRKLMSRRFLTKKKTEETKEAAVVTEDDPYADLFVEDSD